MRPDQRPAWVWLTVGLMGISLGRLAFPDDWSSTIGLITATAGFILVGRYVDHALRWLKDRP